MSPNTLLTAVSLLRRNVVNNEVSARAAVLAKLHPLAGEYEPALQNRLLEAPPTVPDGGALLRLLHGNAGELPNGGKLHAHGCPISTGKRGVALVFSSCGQRGHRLRYRTRHRRDGPRRRRLD